MLGIGLFVWFLFGLSFLFCLFKRTLETSSPLYMLQLD